MNYARFGLLYPRSMERLPIDVAQSLLKGEHVIHYNKGIWKEIWSDMSIETTFMRYDHGKREMIGIILKPETIKIWTLRLHLCTLLQADIAVMCDTDIFPLSPLHKEEMKSRIVADAGDRLSSRTKLSSCIDPLKSVSVTDSLLNIVSGRIEPATVNLDDAIQLRKCKMTEFEQGWPSEFHAVISKTVQLISVTRKHVTIGKSEVFNTDLILQSSSRYVDIMNVLSHELSPVPTSMFANCGDMRICQSKSKIKAQLQVLVSTSVI